jgi:nucleoside-diphosphate-sugar epimerase
MRSSTPGRSSHLRRRRQDFDDVNVAGTRHVIEVPPIASRSSSTPRLSALPPAEDAARRQRLPAHEGSRSASYDAALAGAPIVTVVPGVVSGPGPPTEGNLVARLLHDHLRGRLPGIVGADRQWSFAWIDDVAEAHVSALDRGGHGAEYILGGENAPQMRLFEIARDVTGRRLPRRLPAGLIRLVGTLDEARAWIGGPPPFVTRGAVDIFQEDWPLDSANARELGYTPRALEPGVQAVLGRMGSTG